MKPELLTIDEACESLNCGRTYLYSLISNGELKAVKLGRKTLIPRTAINDFIETLLPYIVDGVGTQQEGQSVGDENDQQSI